MVDRRIGRTERRERRQRRVEFRRLPEAQNGDVREPTPLLALVDAELLQSPEEASSEAPGFLRGVVEHEHPDASRLAVPARGEHDLGGLARRFPQGSRDRRQLAGRTPAKEREREMEMLARDDPAVAEVLVLPRLDRIEDLVREPEGAEEA
jgi:hypothetical protein